MLFWLPPRASTCCLQKAQGDRFQVSQNTWPARSAMAALAQLLGCKICVVWFEGLHKYGQEPAYYESRGKLQLYLDKVLHIHYLCLVRGHVSSAICSV